MRADFERARADLLSTTDGVRRCTPWLMSRLAEDLVGLWLELGPAAIPAEEGLRAAIARRAADIGDVIAQELKDCDNTLQNVLAQIGGDPQGAKEWPQARGRPIYDASSILPLASYAQPPWAFALRPILLWVAGKRIEIRMRGALSEQLSVFSAALRFWGERYLDEWH